MEGGHKLKKKGIISVKGNSVKKARKKSQTVSRCCPWGPQPHPAPEEENLVDSGKTSKVPITRQHCGWWDASQIVQGTCHGSISSVWRNTILLETRFPLMNVITLFKLFTSERTLTRMYSHVYANSEIDSYVYNIDFCFTN